MSDLLIDISIYALRACYVHFVWYVAVNFIGGLDLGLQIF